MAQCDLELARGKEAARAAVFSVAEAQMALAGTDEQRLLPLGGRVPQSKEAIPISRLRVGVYVRIPHTMRGDGHLAAFGQVGPVGERET